MSKIIIEETKIKIINSKTTVIIDFKSKEKLKEAFGTDKPSEKEIKEYLKKE
jgi:hypothetical protein